MVRAGPNATCREEASISGSGHRERAARARSSAPPTRLPRGHAAKKLCSHAPARELQSGRERPPLAPPNTGTRTHLASLSRIGARLRSVSRRSELEAKPRRASAPPSRRQTAPPWRRPSPAATAPSPRCSVARVSSCKPVSSGDSASSASSSCRTQLPLSRRPRGNKCVVVAAAAAETRASTCCELPPLASSLQQQLKWTFDEDSMFLPAVQLFRLELHHHHINENKCNSVQLNCLDKTRTRTGSAAVMQQIQDGLTPPPADPT